MWSTNKKKPIRAQTLATLLSLHLDYSTDPGAVLEVLVQKTMTKLLTRVVCCVWLEATAVARRFFLPNIRLYIFFVRGL
jgi:hypothetical protein